MRTMNDAEVFLISDLSVGKVSELSNFTDLLDTEDMSERVSELASYIKRLEEEGYVHTSRQTFIEGGRLNSKYGNNVKIIYFDKIELTRKGINLVESGKLGDLSAED